LLEKSNIGRKNIQKCISQKYTKRRKNLILKITIISPENKTCTAGEIKLIFKKITYYNHVVVDY